MPLDLHVLLNFYDVLYQLTFYLGMFSKQHQRMGITSCECSPVTIQ